MCANLIVQLQTILKIKIWHLPLKMNLPEFKPFYHYKKVFSFRRNQNFRDIVKGLGLGPKNLGMFDSSNQFHHMFFFGDLNYRLEKMEPTVSVVLSARRFPAILDVLNRKALALLVMILQCIWYYRLGNDDLL